MSIPDYQTAMLPLLQHTAEAGRPVSMPDMFPTLAKAFHLTHEELAERLPSGVQGLFQNRLHWAKFYMTRAGLLESPKRGQFQVSAAGKALLATQPSRIDNAILSQYPAFLEFKNRTKDQGAPSVSAAPDVGPGATPEELIDSARRELVANLKVELLDRVRAMSPGAFEALIILLLVQMGYGQGREEMARVLGGTGDGGVDGVVNQDELGLDRVYIQAKRYKDGNTVGPADINSFIGALNIKRANKGLFVTASSFTKQASEHARSSTLHVVLVDGDGLADLMVRHNVGVILRQKIEIKAIDEGFFDA